MLIGVIGRKGAGKDTFAEGLEGFTVVKMADPLKDMLRSMLSLAGLSGPRIERMIEGDLKEVPHDALCGKTPRFAMQTLGTEWRNMLGQDLWTKIWEKRVRGGDVVCTDIRFMHEAKAIKDRGGWLIRVERPGLEDTDLHISEQEMDQIACDVHVLNDGTAAELRAKAMKYV